MNIHTLERHPDESHAQYRERQAASRAVNLLDVSRFFLGQHTNPSKAPSKRDLRRLAKTFTQKPKPQKVRKHVQHKHPLRDQHGAYTYTGDPRRVWLAGVSAQKGY